MCGIGRGVLDSSEERLGMCRAVSDRFVGIVAWLRGWERRCTGRGCLVLERVLVSCSHKQCLETLVRV